MHNTQETIKESWLRQRLARQLSELLRLSFPIVLQRIGIMTMGVVDTMMVGHFGATDLGYQSAGDIPVTTMIVLSLGLLSGVIILSSNAYGAGNSRECGAIWKRGMLYAGGLGLFFTIICLFGEETLLLLGQEPDISRGGGEVVLVLGLGMPFLTMMLVCTFFLESISKPLPGLVIMIAANLLNILLNWMLVFGHLGFEPMGAVGSAWATSLVRLFILLTFIGYIFCMKEADFFGIREKADLGWKIWGRQRQIGYAAGITNGAEHIGFAGLFVFSGWLGAATLAATTITIKLFGLAFMIGMGIGGATSVRVGIALGRRDHNDLLLAGSCGLGLNFVIMLPLSILLWLHTESLAQWFSSDTLLIGLATPLIALSGLMLLLDTSQSIMGNALRGRQDVWMPTIIYFLCYNVVMVPLCWYMAFPLQRGAEGLFEAVILTSVLAALLAGGRFYYLSWQDHLKAAANAGT
ncbi:MATE family efflux transporter [Emcibacter sp.]|uniref:MATE family efflux transporter n=1 Tax=Emcibacter sp. TaxID=1979954 RepID=UPI002AA736BF|nr:MATE family efflux transporter [Emcibacter sp.]